MTLYKWLAVRIAVMHRLVPYTASRARLKHTCGLNTNTNPSHNPNIIHVILEQSLMKDATQPSVCSTQPVLHSQPCVQTRVVEYDKVKYFVPIPTILSPSAFPPVCRYSVIIFVLLPTSNHFFWLCTLLFFTQHFVCFFCSSATYMFAVHRLLIFPLNVITAKCHYRYYGISASCLPSPWYYREIFSIPAVITVVTAVLPLSPLLCHRLVQTLHSNYN